MNKETGIYYTLCALVGGLAIALCVTLSMLTGNLQSRQVTDFRLDFEITQTSMQPLLKKLASAKSYEQINIYVNSPGGSVDVLNEFLYLATTTEAKVIYKVSGKAFSAAAMATCILPNVKYNKEAVLMFHPFAQGTFKLYKKTYDPTYTSHRVYYGIMVKWLDKCVKRGVLTQDEYKQIVEEGKTVFKQAKDLK